MHVRGVEDRDPRQVVLLVLVAVKEQELVVLVFCGYRCCCDHQVVGDDKIVSVRALFHNDLRLLSDD